MRDKDNTINFVSIKTLEKAETQDLPQGKGKEWGKVNEGGKDIHKVEKEEVLVDHSPLPDTTFFLTDNKFVKEENCKIIHVGANYNETCVINEELTTVCIICFIF